MNQDFRKIALIAASLGLLVSLYFALSPGDDESAQTTTQPETTEPAGTTMAAPEAVTLRVTVVADQVPKVKKFTIRKGRQVTLVVDSEIADEVHVHGYDLMADVEPGKPATIEFTADAPGRFEIELESRGLQIAELEVTP